MGEPDLPWFKRGVASVGDTLRAVGEGLGDAAGALVTRSQSDVGTLAVKTAEVTVELELTTAARESGVGVVAGTTSVFDLRVVNDETSRRMSNRLTIKLQIVAVTEPPPPALPPPPPPPPPPLPWPLVRWHDPHLLEAFIAVTEKLYASAQAEAARAASGVRLDDAGRRGGRLADPDPAPGDPALLPDLAKLVARLLDAVASLPDAERATHPHGAEAIFQLHNLAEFLVQDTSHAPARRAAILALTAALSSYWKGLLSGRPT